MFIEFADVVELGGNLPNQQLGVSGEWGSFVVALVVGLVKVGSEQRREIIKQFNEDGIKHTGQMCLTNGLKFIYFYITVKRCLTCQTKVSWRGGLHHGRQLVSSSNQIP